MSHVFLDRRDGHLRLYLYGDLQYDQRDERLYHEPLALVPAALAARRAPGRPLRALVLGGGDGLAVRELFRIPAIAEVHLVEQDPEVLQLATGPLAELNARALLDARTRVHVMDARDYRADPGSFDVLIYDLTYPADVAAASLFTVTAFARVRAALRPGGVLALNGVSPDLTPQAFGCLGATLAAAGLPAVPYTFSLPSFAGEGYGRCWGFLFASSRRIGRAELRRLPLPPDAELTAAALLTGTRLPAAAGPAMRAAANRTDELLYYVHNATPLPWEGPMRALRFGRGARPGPRLTAAHGFARWLRRADGRRTVEELLACLPLSRRGQTRQAFLGWSEHAEALFRAVDLRAFVDQAISRARELPRGWTRELRRLRDRLAEGLPPMGELLHVAYRVFAIYLLVLLIANLFFPDNLYAKGSSSSSRSWSSSSSSSSSGEPFHGFFFSDPAPAAMPYPFRPAAGFLPIGGPGARRAQVYDPQGRSYGAVHLDLTDPSGARKPLSALLALTPELQLLDSGAVAFRAAVPGYQFLLEPGRLRVLDAAGQERRALLPPETLVAETRGQLLAQTPLIERALADHRRWLDWVQWGIALPPGRAAQSEMAELMAIKGSIETAQEAWRSPSAPPAFVPPAGVVDIFPGVYLEPARFLSEDPRLLLVSADGRVARRGVAPPAELSEEDRFVFHLLNRRLTEGRDQSLRGPVSRWIATFGRARLGLPPPAL